jgi:hypothetical protein
VVGRATGGLTKVRRCAYLYEWLDAADRDGEADALFERVEAAVTTYRDDPERHGEMMRTAMEIDTSWDRSAGEYVDLYRYGMVARRWAGERRSWLDRLVRSLGKDRELFDRFFAPALGDHGDFVDGEFRAALDGKLDERPPGRRPPARRDRKARVKP